MHKIITLFLLILVTTLTNAQDTGQLKGRIVDAANNEPIGFANVVIDGTQKGTSTDIDGFFEFAELPQGYLKLIVSYVGYQTKLSEDILINKSQIPFMEIRIEANENQLEEIVVTVDPFEKKIEAPLSMQSIGTREIEGNPGSNRDISRVIQSFPGVGSTPAFRNDVIIRGGGPSENRFFLDGIEIPVLNHFSTQGASGGPVGIINADFIRNVDFYSGAFPANRYNALSGMLDFKLKDGNKDKTNFQLAVGASETAFTVDGPIGEKTTYIASVRRSYLQFLFSAIGLPFLPTFNDYQVKVKTDFDTKNRLTIISLGSLDQLKINEDIEDPDASQEYILSQIPINNQWSYTIGGVYDHFTDKGSHSFILSRNMLNNEIYKYPDNDESLTKSIDYNSTEAENKFRYEGKTRTNGIKLSWSAQLEKAKYTNTTIQSIFVNNLPKTINYNTDLDLVKYGVSFQATQKYFDSRMVVSAGLRLDGNDYNKDMANLLKQFSPRASISYALDDKTALNAGAGRYFQTPAYTTLGFRDNNNALVNESTARYIGANHFNLGVEHKLSKKTVVSVEGFYKDYFQYPVDIASGVSLANQGAGYAVSGASAVASTGSGRSFGFEVLNRINIKEFTFLGTYTFVNSSFSGLDAGELIPSSWDSRHIVSLTASKTFKKDWRMGLKWRYVGGLPYTPYDLETSSIVDAWTARGEAYLDFTRVNTERFDDFHQLDLRVDKTFYFSKWSLMLYLDIQNAYNFQNTNQDYIIRQKNDDGTFLTTNGGQNYVLEAVENTSGTLLPTIGVMIKI